jgi:glycosyltransferase involved in cell wall biosynthesis
MVGGQETGNETYVRGLIDGLTVLPSPPQVVAYSAGPPWERSGAEMRFQRLIAPAPIPRLGLELPVRSVTDHLDILHTTYVAPLWAKCPTVLSVHDICYETNPEWFSGRDVRMLSVAVPRSIRRADQVITISEASRQQIIDYYGTPPSKITVTALAPGVAATRIDHDQAIGALASTSVPVDRPYLCAVGNLQPRKNLVRLIQAFMNLIEHGRFDGDLVLIGPLRWRSHEILTVAAGLSARIHVTGYLTDLQLAACYSLSQAFAFPSLFEGFGLPPIEAMAHGIPVSCSDRGALPETCGEAAVYFDPMDVDAIENALDSVLNDEPLRLHLAKAGLARSSELTWTRTAEMTMAVYERLA